MQVQTDSMVWKQFEQFVAIISINDCGNPVIINLIIAVDFHDILIEV